MLRLPNQGLVSWTAWDGRSKTTCSLVSTPALSTLILLIEALVLTSDWIGKRLRLRFAWT